MVLLSYCLIKIASSFHPSESIDWAFHCLRCLYCTFPPCTSVSLKKPLQFFAFCLVLYTTVYFGGKMPTAWKTQVLLLTGSLADYLTLGSQSSYHLFFLLLSIIKHDLSLMLYIMSHYSSQSFTFVWKVFFPFCQWGNRDLKLLSNNFK